MIGAIKSDVDGLSHTKQLLLFYIVYMSLVMRKPAFCICENKNADQLRGHREADQRDQRRGYREADQRLCFGPTDSTILLLSKSEKPSSVDVQPGLCRTRSETRMLVFSQRGSYFFFLLYT